ncbi:bifunctional diguanylate cyclase/phosphodiesterase [Martelella endophytica]|uniref:bifunctional diguanylate cyclase/phosphodiesterase n=1 Tax=Martelella endophytica TaxID=1486262 RepID=UPI00069848D7|nr:EAL domain-containing protein [Martelella endophytica]
MRRFAARAREKIRYAPAVWARIRPTAGDLLALAVIVLVIGSMIVANREAARAYTNGLRLKTAERMALSSIRIEEDINENLRLVEGFGSALALEPEIDQSRFERLARKLLSGDTELRSLAIARDLLIEMVYPFAENQEALGLSYADRPDQLAAVRKALISRKAVIDGPIQLVQGGAALLAYYPLYDGTDANAWGILSAVIDLEDVLSDEVIGADQPDLAFAVGKRGPDGKITEILFGQPEVFAESPVIHELSLANTTWAVAAAPEVGWRQTFAAALPRRLLIDAVGIIIITAVLGIAHLMRIRSRNLAALRKSAADTQSLSRRMQLALNASAIGVWEMDLESGKTIWDQRMYELYGVPPDTDESGLDIWRKHLAPEDLEEETSSLESILAAGKPFRDTYRIVHPDGAIRYLQVFGDFYTDPGGHRRLIGVNWDITDDIQLQNDLKHANQEARRKNAALEHAQDVLRHTALHDALTDLANRQYLEHVFVKGNETSMLEPPYAVLHIDLDRFKEINDTLGHTAGDAMLRHAARMLKSIARPNDFIARIGGDEFALVTAFDGDVAALNRLAQDIIRALGRPLSYGDHQIRISASVGIAWMDAEAEAMRDVLVNASIALYEAKRMGRNRLVVFDAALRNIAITNKKVADEIIDALENDEFFVSYQPQINAHTLELSGAEALVRWKHPTRGMVEPGFFIGTAETIGAIARIDALVLQKALDQQRRWLERGLDVPHISVNISAQRLADEMLLSNIETLKPPPGRLRFELLESISFEDSETRLDENVARIKALGIDVEIDDFGTGYASILSLLALSPKSLKIDRQLVFPITIGAGERRLVASIIEIGKALGIEVIAEGVETLEHARILRELGVDSFQGYLFAPPLAPDALERFAREKAWVAQFAANNGVSRRRPG